MTAAFDNDSAVYPGAPISVLNLSPRVRHALRREHFVWISDLTSSTPEDILDIRNLGAGAVVEIEAQLNAHGLALKKLAVEP